MTNILIKENILKEIGELADKSKTKIYIVGGYVRDYFLDRERKDFDITVIGDSIDFAKKVSDKFHSKIVIYERFKTALVPIGDFNVEFVGTRKEEYLSNSRKPITTEGTFEDDINRRDFTINAMACSLNSENFGELIDLHNGIIDLNNKILKTPLDPITTYSDDPLRMMRAARFASQLDFTLEKNSFDAISKMSDRINIISQERIADEFLKILASPKPSIGLSILFNTGLLKHIFPELNDLESNDVAEIDGKKFYHKNVFWHTLRVVDNISLRTDKLWLRFAALMHDIAKPRTKKFIKGIGWTFHGHEEVGARMQKKIFHRMKFPLEPLPYIEKLVRLHQRPMHLIDEEITDSAIRRLAAQAGPELEDLFTLCRADITTKNEEKEKKYKNNYEVVFQKILDVQEKDQLRAFQSPVRGEEIMEICNIQPSRLVGQIKNEIEEAILDGIIPNDYEEAKKFFLENKDLWLDKYNK